MKITLKAARVNAGLTQKEAAKALGISKSTLVSYEARRTTPNIEKGRQIANLYNMDTGDILF